MHLEQADAEIADLAGMPGLIGGQRVDELRDAVLEMRAGLLGRLGEILGSA